MSDAKKPWEHITDEQIDEIESLVGVRSAAWDMIDPKEIVWHAASVIDADLSVRAKLFEECVAAGLAYCQELKKWADSGQSPNDEWRLDEKFNAWDDKSELLMKGKCDDRTRQTTSGFEGD